MDTNMNKLGFWDYVVFAASLLLSAAIGLYYHFSGGRNQTNRAYLLGDKNLSIWPVSMSLMASFMSAITLLGVPAENYLFSTQFVAINISYIIGTPICAYIFLPVFFQLQNTSAYQYLEMRFNRPTRIAASSVFMIQMILYMGIVLYAPALALSAVTGLSKWTSIISVGIVCTLYCTTGGIKAVVWTDFLQSLLMFASVICVAVRGVILVGGFDVVMEKARNGNRLQFWNMNPDPTIRHSFWTLTIGGVFIYTSLYGVNQTQVQRLLTVQSLNKARIALIISWPITSLLSLVTSFTGIVMYAYFEGCDPLKSKVIEQSDQLLPYFMMKVIGDYPGLPGLFVAGIFSGALSSVSSFVNSLAAVTLEDFIKPWFPSLRSPSIKNDGIQENVEEIRKREYKETIIAKLLAFFFGLLCLALTYVAEQMSGILQASLTVFGIVGGPLLGLFTLGMCTRSCSPKAALISFLASLILGFWIGFGSLSSGIKPIPLDTSIEKCSNLNSTDLTTQFSSLISNDTSFASSSNDENVRRSKREEILVKEVTKSMMLNTEMSTVIIFSNATITTTNNNYDNYSSGKSNGNDDNNTRGSSHNGSGYTSSNWNSSSNSDGNDGIHAYLQSSNNSSSQPVNLVHHHSNKIFSHTLKPASLSTSSSSSSSSESSSSSSLLFALGSRMENMKRRRRISGFKSSQNSEAYLSGDLTTIKKDIVDEHGHDYIFLNESHLLFDHEHSGLMFNEKNPDERMKTEWNLDGMQQVVFLNDSVLVQNDLQIPPLEMVSISSTIEPAIEPKSTTLKDPEITNGRKNEEANERIERETTKSGALDTNPILILSNGNSGFKVTTNVRDAGRDGGQSSTQPDFNDSNDVDLTVNPSIVVRSESLFADPIPLQLVQQQSDLLMQSKFDYLTMVNNGSENTTSTTNTIFYLYRLSYLYLAGFTCIFEILLGLLLSYTIFPNEIEVRPELLTPFLHWGIFKSSDNYFVDCAIDGAGSSSSLGMGNSSQAKISTKNEMIEMKNL